MSVRSLSRASIALRSTRHTSASPATLPKCSTQLQRRWKGDSGKEGQETSGQTPFNFQLFESINTRVQKEKAQQIEMAALQQRTARGRFFATVTGMLDGNRIWQREY